MCMHLKNVLHCLLPNRYRGCCAKELSLKMDDSIHFEESIKLDECVGRFFFNGSTGISGCCS